MRSLGACLLKALHPKTAADKPVARDVEASWWLAEHIGSKTAVQVRSHAQKFFSKLEKQEAAGVKQEGAHRQYDAKRIFSATSIWTVSSEWDLHGLCHNISKASCGLRKIPEETGQELLVYPYCVARAKVSTKHFHKSKGHPCKGTLFSAGLKFVKEALLVACTGLGEYVQV